MHPHYQIISDINQEMSKMYLVHIRTVNKLITPMHIRNLEIQMSIFRQFGLYLYIFRIIPI